MSSFSAESEPGYSPEPENAISVLSPPATIIILCVILLCVLSCFRQKLWWKYNITRCSQCSSKNLDGVIFTNIDNTATLLSFEDVELIERLKRFPNRPHVLIQIALITFVSIGVCPTLLMLYNSIVTYYWAPKFFDVLPNTNSYIGSFLTMAGLIYAISFGFAFQEAKRVQNTIEKHILQFVHINNCILYNITTSPNLFNTQQINFICNILKEETMIWIKQILKYSTRVISHNSHLGEINHVILNVNQKGPLDVVFMKKLHKDINSLKLLTKISLPDMCGKMDLFQWVFLQSLANLAFFGILLVNGKSSMYQLVICVLTVFTISIFSYILADLDNPYNGIYQVDLNQFYQLIDDLNTVYSAKKPIPGMKN